MLCFECFNFIMNKTGFKRVTAVKNRGYCKIVKWRGMGKGKGLKKGRLGLNNLILF